MTAIVTDGTAMAADGLTSTTNDMINDNTIKIHRLPDGSIIGAAGAADRWPEAVAELSRSIEADDLPAEMKGDYDLLRLLPNGKVVGYHERLRPHAVAVPAAIGSGGDYASSRGARRGRPQDRHQDRWSDRPTHRRKDAHC